MTSRSRLRRPGPCARAHPRGRRPRRERRPGTPRGIGPVAARPAALDPARLAAAKDFVDGLPPATWHDPAARKAAIERTGSPHRELLGETIGRILGPDRPFDRWVQDLRAAADHLRSAPGSAGRLVGSVGFCLGGALSAALAAEDPQLGAAVVFYGLSPATDLAARIRAPVLGLYGEEDHAITDGVAGFADAVRRGGGRMDAVVYPATPHAFFNDTRPTYRVEAARDAWARALGFLAGHLAPR